MSDSLAEGLYARAYRMGRDAASEYVRTGEHQPPTMVRVPREHARYLLGREGTEDELVEIWHAWEDGVESVWDRRYDDRRN